MAPAAAEVPVSDSAVSAAGAGPTAGDTVGEAAASYTRVEAAGPRGGRCMLAARDMLLLR